MAESVFQRMRRTVAASVETAVDKLERASGSSLMRESLRQIERAMEQLAADHDRALNRAVQADQRSRELAKELEKLSDNARFAMEKKREDLARAALSQQVNVEAEIVALKSAVSEAKKEAVRMLEAQDSLRAQHQEMSTELASFEKTQREAERGSAAAAASTSQVEAKVRHARDAFDRVMQASTAAARTVDSDDQMKVMEIREMERDGAVDDRLRALKAASAAKTAAPRKTTSASKPKAGKKPGSRAKGAGK